MALPAAPASAGLDDDLYGCPRVIHEKEKGNLEKSTDPEPGSTVMPGQTIHVTITWSEGDFDEGELHKVLDCVTVDGKLDEALSGGEKPTDNDGVFEHDYTVPDDAPAGTKVCDRAQLTGGEEEDFKRSVSPPVCFTVGAPAPPEVAPVREVKEAPAPEMPPQVSPGVEVRPAPQALPKTGGDLGLGLASACLGLCLVARIAGRRPRATGDN